MYTLSVHPLRAGGLLLGCGLILSPGVSIQAGPDAGVLLLHDSGSAASVMDCAGSAEALQQKGILHVHEDLAHKALSASTLDPHGVVIACNLNLETLEAALLASWVTEGGGLLASGSTASGLELTLGLAGAGPIAGPGATEVRFSGEHPVSTGSWWEGPIMETPPMPAVEIPNIMQLYYINTEWPAWSAEAGDGSVLARWRDWLDEWATPDNEAAVVVHASGAGRTVYSGALPGAYADWDWPHSWRTFLVSAVEWLATDAGLVEIGHWPDAHRAALAWTGDTEKPAMVTAVPALLALFSELGLDRFGTFYVVGRAGGDEDTLGAVEHPEIVQAIAAAGAEVGGHGDIHTHFANQSYAEQRARLEALKDIINPLLEPFGEQMTGFRAPYLSQDATTWEALADLGFVHDAGESDIWSQTTLPHRLGGLWQIPPSMPMDWHLFEEHNLSAQDVETIFMDKLAYVISRRGLYSWLHHPWVVEDHLDMVRNVLQWAIDQGDLWLARQDDILDWWIKREAITITGLTRHGPHLSVRIDNGNPTGIEGVSIWIRMPPGSPGDWIARAGDQPVPLHHREHGQALFLVAVLPPMPGNSSLTLTVHSGSGIFLDRFEHQSDQIR